MKLKEAPRDHFGLSSWYYNKSLISMADNCLTEDTQRIESGQSYKPSKTVQEPLSKNILLIPHLNL